MDAWEQLMLKHMAALSGIPETFGPSELGVSAGRDAFGRQRVATPTTIFDSKQLGDNRALFWDDQEVSGTGTFSTYTAATSSTVLAVSDATAGSRVRQTFQRFNYQPGKSQKIFLTGTIGAQIDGVTKRWGYFDNNDGIFFQQDDNGFAVGIRSSTSGSPVDNIVYEADFNISPLYDQDNTKSLIFIIDFEWLGVGSVRVGTIIDGAYNYLHQFNHSNILAGVYMTSPNLPIRYEITNDGTGGAASLEAICTSVISEGGQQATGTTRGISGGATATLSGTNSSTNIYAAIGLRNKSTHINNVFNPISFSMLSASADDIEWMILLNPTVAGTFTYTGLTNSSVEAAVGSSNTNTVTGGTVLDCGYLAANGSITNVQQSLRYAGTAIDGTRDTIVLCHRPITANSTVYSSFNWREIA